MESFSNGNMRARQDRFLRELDAWVAEEVDAIGARPAAEEQPARPPENDEVSSAVIDAREHWPDQRQDAPKPVSTDELAGLFETDEDELIEQIVGMIGDRPNADMILDEIWRRVTGALTESEDVVIPLSHVMVEEHDTGDAFEADTGRPERSEEPEHSPGNDDV
jgi:hypothetical protein